MTSRPTINKNASLVFELQQHDFFASMDGETLEELIGLTQTKVFKGRQAIFRQGDKGDALYVVLSGRVKIATLSPAGKETVLCFMGPGDVLGEIAVLDSGVRTASAVVIEETRLMVLRQSVFLSFLERHPKIALHIIRVLCRRMRSTDEFAEQMTTLQAGPRLAKALLRLADQYGRPHANGGTLLDIKLSQANLGAHAGLMRENVNRQLKMWEDEGLLQSAGGQLILHQRDTLKDIANMAG